MRALLPSVSLLLMLASLCVAVPMAYPMTASRAAKQTKLLPRLQQHLLAVATVGLTFFAAVAPVNAGDNAADKVMEDENKDWFKLKTNPPAHQQAVFYFLIDMFEHWRVVHANYVGDDRDGKPLFVSLRVYTRFGDDDVFRFAVSSLVDHEGLVQENIDVEEIEFFPSKATVPYFDITLLKIHDVDMSAYKPIKMTHQVKLFADLEMLSYRIDLADNLLEYFNYPLRYRNCRSGDMANVDNHLLLTNTCSIPYTPAVTGSPIFSDKHELLGLYVGWLDDERHLAVAIPKELLDLQAFAINKKDKLPVLWGELKN